MDIRPISENIRYIEATDAPLSADIGIIRTNTATWLYDVGNDPERITPLQGKYNVVLSHFHQDHTGNLELLDIGELYVSKFTYAHIGRGSVVEQDVYMENLHIFPLPSSHTKGALGLEVDGMYAFIGDGIYSKSNEEFYIYNAQLLKEEIAVLKSLQAKYLLVSHRKGLVLDKEEVLGQLEEIYSARDPLSSEIFVKKG